MLKIKLPKVRYPDSKLKKGIIVPKFNPYVGSSTEISNTGIMRYAEIDSRMTLDLVVF